MECKFVPGQEVICVNDEPYFIIPKGMSDGSLDGLKKGEKYTIDSVYFESHWNIVCVYLVEIPRSVGYYFARFETIRKTDISELTKLLRDLPILEEV